MCIRDSNNGDEKIISAGQQVKVNFTKGKNSVKVFDNQKNLIYDSGFVVNKDRGLLNIAHQDYYINEQFYGYGLNKDSLIAARGATEIDGKNYLNKPVPVSYTHLDVYKRQGLSYSVEKEWILHFDRVQR